MKLRTVAVASLALGVVLVLTLADPVVITPIVLVLATLNLGLFLLQKTHSHEPSEREIHDCEIAKTTTPAEPNQPSTPPASASVPQPVASGNPAQPVASLKSI